jgi:catalase
MGSYRGPILTNGAGHPVSDDNNSVTIGETGSILLEDFHLLDKLAHFDRERIPERVVHAKGAGAHGYFEVTHDVSDICKAKFLDRVGKRTRCFVRFSTVGGESGSADTARDPRGFAVKFYTEEGVYDLVGNNTPIFFIRDPLKFPDFIHTQKRNPETHLKDPDMFWDFLSLVPESVHQVMILFSPRGTPDGYRFMNGYGSHTFKWVNDHGKAHWVKIHYKTDQGIKNLSAEQADHLAGSDPDYATRDLFNAIKRGEYPSWTFYVQVMPLEDAENFDWDPFDLTKVWPHKQYPLRQFGRMVLNRNPANYFAEVEQAAFSPAHMVPGIEPSPDRMLQGRLFSYDDTHRHRLGPNYLQIPINRPINPQSNHQRDGLMTVNENGGAMPNYFPNSVEGTPAPHPQRPDIHPYQSKGGAIGRKVFKKWQEQDDFSQPGALFRLMPKHEQDQLIANLAGHMSAAKEHIRRREIEVFRRCDAELGRRLDQAIADKVRKSSHVGVNSGNFAVANL